MNIIFFPDIFAPYHTFLGQLEHAFNIQAPLGVSFFITHLLNNFKKRNFD